MASDGLLSTDLGPLRLRSPLIAASGTVGAVWEWSEVADVSVYGAAVAKSVSSRPWDGRPPPRIAAGSAGMLNGIGIQNPGIEAWAGDVTPRVEGLGVPLWGSAVGGQPSEFASVCLGLAECGVSAIELNLSCPNLDDGEMFSFSAARSRAVIEACAGDAAVPVGAKLSPNTPDIVKVATACIDAGASFLTLTNTAQGFGVDPLSRRPLLSGGVGGYSGPGLKPIALRCVFEVAQAMPGVPIVGCGGASDADDVVEYLLAGASAVALGTRLLAEPNAGRRIARNLEKFLVRQGVRSVGDLVGAVEAW